MARGSKAKESGMIIGVKNEEANKRQIKNFLIQKNDFPKKMNDVRKNKESTYEIVVANYKTMRKKLLLLAIALIVSSGMTAASNTTSKDLSVQPTLEKWSVGNHTNLFTITNQDHVSGTIENIKVQLEYNATITNKNNESRTNKGNSEHHINKYTSSGTGTVELLQNDTAITLCARITTEEVNDSNQQNNQGCWHYAKETNTRTTGSNETNTTMTNSTDKNMTNPQEETTKTNDSKKETICTALSINGLPQIAEDAEQLKYRFEDWQEGDKVTYWIENLHGEEKKKSYTTTTQSEKSYTVKVEKETEVLLFKAKRERRGCNESTTEKVVAVRGEKEIDEEEEEIYEDALALNILTEDEGQRMIVAEVTISKENNARRVIYLQLSEDAQKITKTKIAVKAKGTYALEIPLLLPKSDCDGELDEYVINAMGLGSEDEEIIIIEEDEEECKKETREETVGEEEKNKPTTNDESTITSAYVLARKHAEAINLFIHTKTKTTAQLIKVEKIDALNLEEGKNTISITPQVGNNTYILLREGNHEIVHFFLEGEEEKELQAVQKGSSTATTTTANENAIGNEIQGHYKIPVPNQVTAAAIAHDDNKERKEALILLGIVGIAISVGAAWQLKRKHLRTKQDSAKTPWQAMKTSWARKRSSKKSKTKATSTQAYSLK